VKTRRLFLKPVSSWMISQQVPWPRTGHRCLRGRSPVEAMREPQRSMEGGSAQDRSENDRSKKKGCRMKRQHVLILFAVVFLVASISGCAGVQSPVNGMWYTGVTAPVAATGEVLKAPKEGRASCSSVLGLIATGDAGIPRAMANGGITKVQTIDYEAFSVFGFYSKYTTVVRGE